MTAAVRKNSGCTDTDDNSADFTVVAPVARNSSTAAFSCVAVPTITTGTATPNPATQGGSVTVTYTTTDTFGTGNVFSAELSTVGGTFPGTALSTTASTAGSLTVTVPGGTTPGAAYTIRINASTPFINGSQSGVFAVTTAPCLADNFDAFPFAKWTVNGVTQNAFNRIGSSGGSAVFNGAGHSLTNATALSYPSSLDFFVARSSGSTAARSLLVQVSIDGGSNYTTLVAYAITDLTATFAKHTIDLSAYQTRSSVLLRFLRGAETSTAQLYLEDVAVTCGLAPMLAIEPTTPPTLSTANVVFSQADVVANGGNGAQQLVVIHATSVAAGAPVDGNTYPASTIFGSGATTGPGNYVVYAGPTGTVPNTFTVTGLSATTGYTLEAYAYNDNATPGLENYLTTASSTASFTTTAPIVFYAKATGALNLASTFGTSSDGSGNSLGDFTTVGTVYNVAGNNRTISANWTVTGAGSKVVLTANASLVIPTGLVFSGKLDQLANSTLVIQHTAAAAYNSITQGVQDASSTIDFAQTGTFTVPASSTFAYQNLKLTNGTKTLTKNTGTFAAPITSTVVPGNLTLDNTVLGGNTSSPFSSIDLTGNLTLVNGATFNNSSSARITLNLFAATPQTIAGNSSNILLSELFAYKPGGGVILSDAGGPTTLELGNLASGGYYLETGTTLVLNSNTLRFYVGGKAVISAGTTASTGLGTVTASPASSISLETGSNYSIGTLRLTPGATTVNNFRLQAFSDRLTVPSDLTVNGVLTLANGGLQIGDGATPATLTLNGTIVNTGSGNIVGSATTNLVVGGTGILGTLIFAAGLAEINNFTLNRTSNGLAALGTPLTLGGTLVLTAGNIATTATNLLTLKNGAMLTGGSASSFVNGPMARITGAGAATMVFPVGKSTFYRPITLSSTVQTAASTYTAEQFEGNSSRTLSTDAGLGTAPLARVSSKRFYTVKSSNTTAGNFTGTVTLSFGAEDYVNVPSSTDFVIARRDATGLFANQWTNLGRSVNTGTDSGAGGASVAGTLTSASFSDFSDFVLGAQNDLSNTNVLAATNPLPVELTSFSAQRQADKTVLVKWATASEKNSAHFEVQRSLNGREFATTVTLAAQGSSTRPTAYSILDKSAPVALLYYRLRQVDLDGTSALSPVVAVFGAGQEAAKVQLYPNSAHRRISFIADAATPYRILNQLGQPLLHGTTEVGTASIDLEALPTGLYFMELQTAVGRTVQKFEKTMD